MTIKLTDKKLYEKTVEVTDFDKCYHKALKVYEWLVKIDNAIAVSFNQLGFIERCFVIKKREMFGVPCSIIINPTFVPQKSAKLVDSEEGCLSFPNRKFRLKRYNKITAKYYDFATKKYVNFKFSALGAIMFQHEISHLDGTPEDILEKEMK